MPTEISAFLRALVRRHVICRSYEHFRAKPRLAKPRKLSTPSSVSYSSSTQRTHNNATQSTNTIYNPLAFFTYVFYKAFGFVSLSESTIPQLLSAV
jgi:hypothetical protein